MDLLRLNNVDITLDEIVGRKTLKININPTKKKVIKPETDYVQFDKIIDIFFSVTNYRKFIFVINNVKNTIFYFGDEVCGKYRITSIVFNGCYKNELFIMREVETKFLMRSCKDNRLNICGDDVDKFILKNSKKNYFNIVFD